MAARNERSPSQPIERFRNDRNPQRLTLADLLVARDAYQTHLANLPNVIGSAVGRYRIRVADPDSKTGAKDWLRPSKAKERTLGNSVIRAWSWPAVLVFVKEWHTRAQQRAAPEEMVPPWLYLPDGRRIPTCVILAPRQLTPTYSPAQLTFPTGLYGGGYPVMTVEQGTERIGTLSCLVTDGHDVYGLTNRHVVGTPGTRIYTLERGELKQIGTTVSSDAHKVPLETLYAGWIGKRVAVNVDAGLFRIDDLANWTSQVYGVGRLGDPVDLGVDTLSLNIIGCPVRAFGGASGALRGTIQGLFYRYGTVGGQDFVADLLIGPREGEQVIDTRPGDSGTLWMYDSAIDSPPGVTKRTKGNASVASPKTAEYRPVAVQWGGHSFLVPGGDGDTRFALATMLSNVCRLLDVEVVRDWSIEHSQYWGKVGHYKIAYSACFLASSKFPRLRSLLQANAQNIAVSDADIESGAMPMATNKTGFIALADVPDLVWRTTRKRDQANHFADMDQPASDGEFKGKSLMELWQKHPATRTPQSWESFYDGVKPVPKVQHRGALPFRVKQLFEEMVRHLQAKKFDEFLCVAGVLAHYVGDACQPLHVSHLHHGASADESAVHSVYETKMLDRYAAEFIGKLNAKLGQSKAKGTVKSGDEAADLTVQLMSGTMKRLPPERVLEVFREVQGRGQLAHMWEELATPTVAVTAEGCLALAKLWQSAWHVAGAEKVISKTASQKTANKNRLRSLYNKPKIAEAKWLRDM